MKKFIAFMIIGFLICSVAHAELGLYPLCGRIVEIDYFDDVVIFEDGAGLAWCFYGVEDYHVGDFVACIMDSAGTDTILDDIICDVCYAGVF